MEIASLSLMLSATLYIHPNRTQFFKYDSINLSCVAHGDSRDWTLRRNTSSETSEPCGAGWGAWHGASCAIGDLYLSDSGSYWCESARGQRSDAVNVTVTGGQVILESPALPVAEGEEVTLVCSARDEPDDAASSNLSASFYKDDGFIGAHAGAMVLPAVSASDAGFYKCRLPTKGMSPPSWLAVIAGAPPPPPLPPARLLSIVLLSALYSALLAVSVTALRRWARGQAEAKKRAADVPPQTDKLDMSTL